MKKVCTMGAICLHSDNVSLGGIRMQCQIILWVIAGIVEVLLWLLQRKHNCHKITSVNIYRITIIPPSCRGGRVYRNRPHFTPHSHFWKGYKVLGLYRHLQEHQVKLLRNQRLDVRFQGLSSNL